jgi:hypothetical protein
VELPSSLSTAITRVHRFWSSRHDPALDARLGRIAVVLIVVSIGVFAIMTVVFPPAAEDLGRAMAQALIACVCAYFTLRGLGRGVAKLICAAAVLLASIVLFFVLSAASARQRQHTEILKVVSEEKAKAMTVVEDCTKDMPSVRATFFSLISGELRPSRERFERLIDEGETAASMLHGCEEKLWETQEQIAHRISAIDPSAAAEFLKGAKSALERKKAAVDKQARYFRAISVLSRFLSTRTAQMRFDGGRIVLQKPVDHAAYDKALTTLAKMEAEIKTSTP